MHNVDPFPIPAGTFGLGNATRPDILNGPSGDPVPRGLAARRGPKAPPRWDPDGEAYDADPESSANASGTRSTRPRGCPPFVPNWDGPGMDGPVVPRRPSTGATLLSRASDCGPGLPCAPPLDRWTHSS
ncbi:hypothetical protein IscW_ISCW023210 [Ixodes scapularis]|uniref:Uncharacterized protein n=1 Tax=Ixodes scapularis TaxID=6945 RepID=B7QJ93_IXOSC|nr:hypothetical protein IscW_ISCW023210 [Ixodes scapularis]|eukprot:XP_002415250.1 hypothetical protein IscW_ISCW023210 [Ixodes scapularis]